MSDGSASASVGAVLARHRSELHAMPGVVGVAQGRNQSGADVIIVYVTDATAAGGLPAMLEGYPVNTVVSGPVEAYDIE